MRNKPFSTVLSLLALAAPMLAQTVKIDFDNATDFGRLRTFVWKDAQSLDGSTLHRNSLMDQRIKSAVMEQAAAKGMRQVSNDPDAYVTYFIGAKDRTEVDTFGYAAGPRWRTGWTDVMVRNYKEGTGIVDIIDARTNQLVWRAYCPDTVKDPKDREKKVHSAAKKAFEKYPPAKK